MSPKEAAGVVLQAFDDGFFCRDVSRDHEPGWAVRLSRPVLGLATLRRWVDGTPEPDATTTPALKWRELPDAIAKLMEECASLPRGVTAAHLEALFQYRASELADALRDAVDIIQIDAARHELSADGYRNSYPETAAKAGQAAHVRTAFIARARDLLTRLAPQTEVRL